MDMRLDPQMMARKQVPRHVGQQICEFRGLGVLPVVHLQFLDMKNLSYAHKVKAGLKSKKVQDQLVAFENIGKLVAVQIDKEGTGELGFKQWWGILQFSDFKVTDDGIISFVVVKRLTEWPQE